MESKFIIKSLMFFLRYPNFLYRFPIKYNILIINDAPSIKDYSYEVIDTSLSGLEDLSVCPK